MGYGIRLQMYLANPRSDVGLPTTNGEDVGGDFSKVYVGDFWYSTTQGGGPRPIFHAAREPMSKYKIQVFAHLHRFGIIVVCITFSVISCVAEPGRQGLGLGYWSR